MVDYCKEVEDKLRRTLLGEFKRMEDDADEARDHRKTLVDKLMTAAADVKILTADNGVNDDTETGLKVVMSALKALDAVEKSNALAISLKLRHSEAEVASAAIANDRIEAVMRATAPGIIRTEFPAQELQSKLDEMFQDEIQDFELKSNPRSLDESLDS